MKKTFCLGFVAETSSISVADLIAPDAHELRTRFEEAMRIWGVLAENQEIDWEAITPALCAKMLPLAFTQNK